MSEIKELDVYVANTLYVDMDSRKYLFFITNSIKRPQDVSSLNTKKLLKLYDEVYTSLDSNNKLKHSRGFRDIHRRYRGN